MSVRGTHNQATESGRKPHRCHPCVANCDVLLLAAVQTTTQVWKCPMMLGTELMDRAVALALIRASLDGSSCIVIRIGDLDDRP